MWCAIRGRLISLYFTPLFLDSARFKLFDLMTKNHDVCNQPGVHLSDIFLHSSFSQQKQHQHKLQIEGDNNCKIIQSKVMNIYLILALIFVVDNGYAFAPASSSLTQCSKLYLYSARASDKEHDVLSANSNTKDPIVSAREARVSGPFAILLSQALPKAAFAKGVNQFDETVKIYFPGSIPSTTVLLRVQSTLRKRQYQPYNTILASSISSDEIVNTPTSVVNLLRNKLSESKDGGVYTLGGLGGIPFTGSAGIDDLLSHAPKDGRIMIYFGPQVSRMISKLPI